MHGLFDFFLNNSWSSEEIPTLLAPVAFSNACLKQGQIKSNSEINIKAKDQVGKFEKAYCIELTGSILPTGFILLCDVFKTSQKGKFSCSAKTFKNSIGINYCTQSTEQPPTSPSGSPGKPPLSDNISEFEQLKEPSALDGRTVIKKLVCEDGKFIVTPQRLLS